MNKAPAHRLRNALSRLAAGGLMLGAVGACEQIGLEALSPGPHVFQSVEEDDPRVPNDTVMRFNLPTLDAASSLLFTRVNEDDGIVERKRTWRTAGETGLKASIIVHTRTNGRDIAVPADVREAIKLWPDLYMRKPAFGKLYETHNSLGRVLWQRFESGGQLCVLFQQGVGPNPNEYLRRVAGYYCAPAGESLTPGQGETVVRSVQLVDRDG